MARFDGDGEFGVCNILLIELASPAKKLQEILVIDARRGTRRDIETKQGDET